MVQMARLPEELVAISNRNGGRPSLDVALALVSALGHFEEGFVPHLTTIARHSLEMCRFLDLGDAETQRIRNAALIHDIGKIAIPPSILQKPGPLTLEEEQEMRRHCEIGAVIAASIPLLTESAPIIRHHHERWDGTGYPDRLAGTAIPLGARILAVADAFTAMTENRSYRQRMQPDQAVGELLRCSGSAFDPQAVQAFMSSAT